MDTMTLSGHEGTRSFLPVGPFRRMTLLPEDEWILAPSGGAL
jgi:hypothetical protein